LSLKSFSGNITNITDSHDLVLAQATSAWDEAEQSGNPEEKKTAADGLNAAMETSPFYGPILQVAQAIDPESTEIDQRRARLRKIPDLARPEPCPPVETVAYRKDLLPLLGLKVPFHFVDPQGARWRIEDEIDLLDLLRRQQLFEQTFAHWQSCQITDQEMVGQVSYLLDLQNTFAEKSRRGKEPGPERKLPNRATGETVDISSLNAHSGESFQSILNPRHELHRSFAFTPALACALIQNPSGSVAEALSPLIPSSESLPFPTPNPGMPAGEETTCRYLAFRDAWTAALGNLLLSQAEERSLAARYANTRRKQRMEAWQSGGTCRLDTDQAVYPDFTGQFRCP
jgi:hypothetical protein